MFLLWFVMTFIKMVLVWCNLFKLDVVTQLWLTICACSWSSSTPMLCNTPFCDYTTVYLIILLPVSCYECLTVSWLHIRPQFSWMVLPHLCTSWQILHWLGSGLRTAAAPAPLTTQWRCSFTLTHQSTNTHRLKSVPSDLPCFGKGLPGLRMQEHLILQCGFLN